MTREIHTIEHTIERGESDVDITVYYTITPGQPMYFNKSWGNWEPPEAPEVDFTGKIDGIPCDSDLTEEEYDEIQKRIHLEGYWK